MTSDGTGHQTKFGLKGELVTQLEITGMTCESCATHVKQALEKVPGVRSAGVSYATGIARLAMASDTPLAALKSAVASLGYRAAQRSRASSKTCRLAAVQVTVSWTRLNFQPSPVRMARFV